MSTSHPLASAVLPYCRKYPNQAGSIFQAFLDLNLAQAWTDVDVLDLPECDCVVLTGYPKPEAPKAFVLPMALSQPTSLAEFGSIFNAIDSRTKSIDSNSDAAHNPSAQTGHEPIPNSAEPLENDFSLEKADKVSVAPLYLGIVEKDSSIVYYVLRKGIVSPKEVPE